ncbi:hypothetical protein CPB84DRAFT_1778333 [Gymnopilus junonius]|uniref:Uncharacterized protein n=1 Tax=Gymnopilus junonius TaxID=109634 RepID=A0A9P5TMG4_GYMJU|nr:hypothetical protein CPB84DRAFT_1778333 [Gymnopilus junonius]
MSLSWDGCTYFLGIFFSFLFVSLSSICNFIFPCSIVPPVVCFCSWRVLVQLTFPLQCSTMLRTFSKALAIALWAPDSGTFSLFSSILNAPLRTTPQPQAPEFVATPSLTPSSKLIKPLSDRRRCFLNFGLSFYVHLQHLGLVKDRTVADISSTVTGAFKCCSSVALQSHRSRWI